jgi:hypothetical protein
MTSAPSRDATGMLTDYLSFTPWFRQLKTRCAAAQIWPVIDPDGNTMPRTEPEAPEPPSVRDYPPLQSLQTDEGDFIPQHPSELSTAGSKAYKEDVEHYKMLLEGYKISNTKYTHERAAIKEIVVLIQTTVSQHLQNNCCIPGQSIREWIISLRKTVGVDMNLEKIRARDRYLASLKQMRSPAQWDTWLTEYDHAATEAERYGVGETYSHTEMMHDFLAAIARIAPMWKLNFESTGLREVGIDRKEMMKRFREYMVPLHPSKGKQHRSALAAGEPSLAGTGESIPGTDRDASHVADDATSATKDHHRGRGKAPRKRKTDGRQARSGQSSLEDTAAAGGQKCPACEQRHSLKDCYYLYPDQAPEWFTPRPGIAAMVRFRRENDADLQEEMRTAKRPRSQTPRIKQSHTPTPDQ